MATQVKIVMTSLEEGVTRECPECGADVPLDAGTIDSQIEFCPEPGCRFEMEVVFFDPTDELEVKRIKEVARKRGPKVGNTKTEYPVEHLDLSKSPALIPAPSEEEDYGE